VAAFPHSTAAKANTEQFKNAYLPQDQNGYEGVAILPRWSTALYYDTSTADELAGAHNRLYPPPAGGAAKTLADVVAADARRVVLQGLLPLRMDGFMFHQVGLLGLLKCSTEMVVCVVGKAGREAFVLGVGCCGASSAVVKGMQVLRRGSQPRGAQLAGPRSPLGHTLQISPYRLQLIDLKHIDTIKRQACYPLNPQLGPTQTRCKLVPRRPTSG
jgi:hypothetical protein